MQRDVLREANEHRLLVKDILAAVHDMPSEHRRWEAVNATVRCGCVGTIRELFRARGGALVNDAQLPLCPIVEPDAPIKKIAHDDPRWSAFHSGADTFDAPLRALKWSLLRRAPQNAGLVATPVPRLRLPQQVARRFDASMHQTESNDAFCVGIRGYEAARRLQHRGQQRPWDRLVLYRVHHLQKVGPNEMAYRSLELGVPDQTLVEEHADAVLHGEPRNDEGRDVSTFDRINSKIFGKEQHFQTILWA
mmetsp:Transcript_45100/g.125032  ORF Transcript_45100/g.125032 Transcript_45100/m.125032 type:complete len:249 (+) Transcript_45100:401-1147(+)